MTMDKAEKFDELMRDFRSGKKRWEELPVEVRYAIVPPEPIRAMQKPNPTMIDVQKFRNFMVAMDQIGCRKFGVVNKKWCLHRCPLGIGKRFESKPDSPGVCKYEKYGRTYPKEYFGERHFGTMGFKVKKLA